MVMKTFEINGKIACQNQLGLSNRKRGRYDLEIVAFSTLKNATVE